MRQKTALGIKKTTPKTNRTIKFIDIAVFDEDWDELITTCSILQNEKEATFASFFISIPHRFF